MKKDNTTQLTSSYQNWKQSIDEDPIKSIHDEIASYINDDFYKEAFKLYVAENISTLWQDLENGLMFCESPIEKMMAVALMITGNNQMYVRIKVKKMYFGKDVSSAAEHILIEPQAKLGEYRVDFLLTVSVLAPRYDLVDGKRKLTGSITVEKQMVLECDGHDYHEKSKEQAKADKNRDRTLQKLGFLVFRYTGSEIWTNVFECAQEAVNTLWEKANDEAWESERNRNEQDQ